MQLNSLAQLKPEDIYAVLPTTGESVTRILSPEGKILENNKLVGVEKAQMIRLVDMFVLGPAMLYVGLGKTLPEGLKALMFLTGVGTIIYNGYNYYQNELLKK